MTGRLRCLAALAPTPTAAASSAYSSPRFDDRPGFHAGVYAKHDSGIELRALRYDNRADPTVYKPPCRIAPGSRNSIHWVARYDGPGGIAVIAQWLNGTTAPRPFSPADGATERVRCGGKAEFGKHRLAVRYDDFEVWMPPTTRVGRYGHAWTLGWTWKLQRTHRARHRMAADQQRVADRAALGEPASAREPSLQLAIRWGGSSPSPPPGVYPPPA